MIPFRRFQCRFACRCDSRPQKSLMRLRRTGTMELSQGKQSKSGKKREREKRRVRMEKEEENGGEWNSLTVSPSSSPPTLFSETFFFFFSSSVSHNVEHLWVCEWKCALKLMGCQSTSGILGDISSHTDRRVRSNYKQFG